MGGGLNGRGVGHVLAALAGDLIHDRILGVAGVGLRARLGDHRVQALGLAGALGLLITRSWVVFWPSSVATVCCCAFSTLVVRSAFCFSRWA
jgi:hypothetical protein